MPQSAKIALAAVAAALLLFLLHGTVSYHLMKEELAGVARLRADHVVAMNGMRERVAERERELSAAAKEAASLRERVNTLIAESREAPDVAFLTALAAKLRGVTKLDDDPLLVELYRGRPVIAEALPVADFFTRKGEPHTVLRFPPDGVVGRAEFPHDAAGNEALRMLDRKKTLRVTFVGKIHDFGGQFEIVDARVLAIGQ